MRRSLFFALILVFVLIPALPVRGQEGPKPHLFVRSSWAEPAATPPGGAFELFVELHNVGAGGASNIFVSFSGAGFIPEGSSSVKNIASLQPGEHGTVSQRLRVAQDLGGGPHSITINLSYEDGAGETHTRQETVGVTVLAPTPTVVVKPGKPNVVIEQFTTTPPLPAPGDPFTLTLTLHNAGSGAARNVFLTHGSPSSFAPLASGNVLAVGNIGWQETVQTALRLVGDREAKPGLHVHPITLDYDNWGGEHTTSPQSIALELGAGATEQAPPRPLVIIDTYDVTPPTLSPGAPFTLTLRVSNVGGAAARQVTVEMGSARSQTSSIDVAPLGTGNVRFLPRLDAGVAAEVVIPFITSGAAASGVYVTEVKLNYVDDEDSKIDRTEQISLRVVAAPRLQLNFYRPLPPAQAGQFLDLPIEIYNIGRSRFNSTTVILAGENLEVQTPPSYIGPIDSGSSVTLDGAALALAPGPARVIVRIEYVDDFNQVQVYEDGLLITVAEALAPEPIDPMGPDGGLPPEPAPAPRPLLLRLLRGLFGVGSG